MTTRRKTKKSAVEPERMAVMLMERNIVAEFIEWFTENEDDFEENADPLEIASAFVAEDDEEDQALEAVLDVLG